MAETHVFRFASHAPQFANAFGSRATVTRAEFPLLDRMSLYRLILAAGAFREPHWHPNAHELGYCLRGRAVVTIFGNGNERSVFAVDEGQMFFVPSGFLHAIENVGASEAEIIICFSHAAPEDFGLSGSVGAMSLDVMGNTWGLDSASLAGLTRSVDDIVIGGVAGQPDAVEPEGGPSPYRFAVEEQVPPGIDTLYGGAKLARASTWPALRDLSMFSLRLLGTGMREPHWHPETAELGYVVEGRARMTVRSPGAAVDTYLLGPGDVYFIPRAYPHHIENIGEDTIHFLVFFDQANGGDIGYTGGISAFPPRLVAPTLMAAGARLPPIPATPRDLAVVHKVNPVD